MRRFASFWLALLLAPLTAVADPVNINSADAATLARELKGIGVTRAEAIVAYRQKNGPFRSADELGLVKGIGTKVIEQNRTLIRIDGVRKPMPAVAPAGKPQPPKR
jgi:competence protein ComEA